MGDEFPAKSFKSGNSVAIRIPAILGVEPGVEFKIRRDSDGALILEAVQPKSERINLSDVYGKAKAIKRLPFEDRERDWDMKPK